MRCNPWRWLWGAIPIAMLAWVAVLAHRESIELDLARRADSVLARSGLNLARVSFIARDAVLTGRGLDDAQQAKAMQAVGDTWGVRSVDNRLWSVDTVERYVWIATRNGNRIRLEGHVPSDAARRDIADLVKATFPNARVDDKLVITRGAPPLETWLAGIGFGLKQLAVLKDGQVDLEGTALSLHGEAIDQPAYAGVKALAASDLPKGVSLRQNDARAPAVRPWVSRMTLAGDRLAITGSMPDERTRERFSAAVKASLPKLEIEDGTEVASGEPRDLAVVLDSLAGGLGSLEEAVIDVRDASVSITGVAASKDKADAFRAVLSRIPASFKVSEQITARGGAPDTPYVTQAALEGGAVVLTGRAPSEDARSTLVAAARRAFGREVRDALEIGRGAGATWERCLDLGFDALRQLDKGRAVLIDRRLEVTGVADSERTMQELTEALRDAAGADCATETRITFPAPAPATPQAQTVVPGPVAATEEMRPPAAKASPQAEPAPAVDEDRRRIDEELRQRAAAAAAAEIEIQKRREVANQCQDSLRTVARQGVIHFDYAEAKLDKGSHATLTKVAEAFARCPEFKVVIEGHTDADGAPDRNQRLSDRRARAVLEYLAGKGVPRVRLEAVGHGQDRNIAPNDTSANKAKNRRIEFNVVAN